MVGLIKKYVANDKIRYLVAGVATTLVNLISFFLLRNFTNIDRNTSNVIAILLAITFAYFANKFFVFRVETKGFLNVFREFVSFYALRFVSMLVEVLGFALLCDSFRISELIAKLAVQFVVLVLNYVFSKLFVFKKERRTVKEIFLDNYCYFISFAVVFVVMMVVVVTEHITPFGENSLSIVDSLHQYLPFFSEYRDKLLNEGSLFYTWNVALGSNFVSLASYYLSSPFNFIFLILGKESIAAGYTIIAVLKISLCAVTMTHFLSNKDGNKTRSIHVIGISVAYALSNYVVGYYWNVMWLDCLMIFPLVVLGFIKLMEDGDPKMYAISLFYALYCNYYIGFIICVFMVLWFLVYNHRSFKKLILDGVRFAVFSIISGGMAAFLLIPAYKGIMLTASAKTNIPKWSYYGSFAEMFKKLLLLTKPMTNQTFDGGVNLYCSILAVFAYFMFMLSRKIKLFDKIRYTLLLAFLMLSFNTLTLNYIWHGFHDQYGIPNRFSFLFIFVILIAAYDVIKKSKYIELWQVILSVICAAGFVLACNRYAKIEVNIIRASLVTIVIYGAVSALRALNVYKGKFYHVMITGFCLVEVCANAIVGFYNNGYSHLTPYYETSPSITVANKKIDEIESKQKSGFYRRELMDSKVLDEATWHNMHSIGTFNSTVLGEVTTMMGRLGFYTGANEFLYMGATPFTNSILNVKYLLKRDGDLDNFEFDYVDTIDDVGIYRNPYPLSIGFAVDEATKDWSRGEALPLNNQNSLVNAMTGMGNIFYSVYPEIIATSDTLDLDVQGNKIYYENKGSGKTSISASFIANVAGDYYLNCRGNYITKIRFYVNGEEIAYDRYQIQIFHLGQIKPGDYVTVEYCYNNLTAKKDNASLYMAIYNSDVYDQVYDILNDNLLQVSEYKDGYVKGSIDMPEDKILFTSIPYDKGWKLFVDGKEAPYYAIGEAFIGADIPAGVHRLELIYTPSGLYVGIIVSLASWGMLLLYILATNDKKEEKN